LSEGNKAHWLLLIIADRVDVFEHTIESLFRLRPHNPLQEMGLGVELRRGVFRSRFNQHRADVRRQRRVMLLALGVGGILVGRKLVQHSRNAQGHSRKHNRFTGLSSS
jgi:hypothetical protein